MDRDTKKCPFCGELIKSEAIKCRYCGEFLNTPKSDQNSAGSVNPESQNFENPMYDSKIDSTVLLSARPSLAALTPPFVSTTALIVIAIVLMMLLPSPYNIWLPLAIIIFTAIWIGIKVLSLKCVNYQISAERIEYQRGILSRQIDNLDMFRVTDLRLHQTLSDRLFKIGTIEIISSDSTHPTFWLMHISKPREVYDMLKQASMNADRKRGVVHYEQ